jgi:hypothetical protein
MRDCIRAAAALRAVSSPLDAEVRRRGRLVRAQPTQEAAHVDTPPEYVTPRPRHSTILRADAAISEALQFAGGAAA